MSLESLEIPLDTIFIAISFYDLFKHELFFFLIGGIHTPVQMTYRIFNCFFLPCTADSEKNLLTRCYYFPSIYTYCMFLFFFVNSDIKETFYTIFFYHLLYYFIYFCTRF